MSKIVKNLQERLKKLERAFARYAASADSKKKARSSKPKTTRAKVKRAVKKARKSTRRKTA